MRAPSKFGTCRGTDRAFVDGIEYRSGDKLRLRLGPRRADSFDILLNGLTATLEKIFHDPENNVYLAVTMDDDPAQPIQRQLERFSFYFPDEVEFVAHAKEAVA